MQDPVGVQVLQTEGHLNEELPYLTLAQVLTHLLLQKLAQVLILAQFHHYVQLVTRLELVIEADHVLVL